MGCRVEANGAGFCAAWSALGSMAKLVSIMALFLLVDCAAVSEPRTWGFVQSVGGIEVGSPTQVGGAWVLPIHGNVSGLQTITVKPMELNSGLACYTRATVEGASIYITVATGVAGSGRIAQCPSANLGSLAPGHYTVLYRGPNEEPVELRVVSIGA